MEHRTTRNFVNLLLGVAAFPVAAANWPAWRGPDGNGVSPEKNLPLKWSTNENVRWRAALPERGNSSPIVWGDRVFVTQAISSENRRTVMCFDRANGKALWQAGVSYSESEPTQSNNGYCSASPVTDGERVIAWFGSAGLYCYDFAGKELWHRDLGKLSHMHGNASSPILVGDLCVLHVGPGQNARLLAVNKRTGETVWEAAQPKLDPGEQPMGGGFGGPGGPGGRGGRGGFGPGNMLAGRMLEQADKNGDGKVSQEEFTVLADAWFDKLDSAKAGKLDQEQFSRGFNQVMGPPQGFGPPDGAPDDAGPPDGGRGGSGPGGFGPGRFVGGALFTAADSHQHGALTREDLKTAFTQWFTQWDTNKTGALNEEQLSAGLNSVLPQPQFGRGGPGGGPGGPDQGPGGPGGPGGFGGRGGPGGFGPGGTSGSWSTPILIKNADHDELIFTFPNRIQGYDPLSGKQLWFAKMEGEGFRSSPVFGEGTLVAMTGGMGRGNSLALKVGGSGDVTENQRLWTSQARSQIGSSVIWEGHLYSIAEDGTAGCLDLATGKAAWEQRLRGSSGRNSSWSSIVLAGGRLYVPNQAGDVFVLKASPNFELLATNSVKERTNASLAVSDGQIFLRTEKSLWCFAAPN